MEWNSNLAYSIGLISTDGNLSKDQRHICFTSTDLELINTYKKCLGISNRITTNPRGGLSKKICYRVQFCNVSFYNSLKAIGLNSNKSLKITSLNIPNEYLRDYLRGHLDGDGSIITYKDKYLSKNNPNYVYQRVFVYFRSASEKHIGWIKDRLYVLKRIRCSLQKESGKNQIGNNFIYRLKLSTNASKILLSWIYYDPNLPCLLRKRNKIPPNFIKID